MSALRRRRLVLVVTLALLAFAAGAFADDGVIVPCPPACGCPPSCKSIEYGSFEWWFGSVCGGWPKSCSLHPEEESTLSNMANAVVRTLKGSRQ